MVLKSPLRRESGGSVVNIKGEVKTALRANSALVALLGNADKVQYFYPDDFNKLPIVTYKELDNSISLGGDNQEVASEIIFVLEVWSKSGTSDIALQVDKTMQSLYFGRMPGTRDLYETDTKTHHKVMIYQTQRGNIET